MDYRFGRFSPNGLRQYVFRDHQWQAPDSGAAIRLAKVFDTTPMFWMILSCATILRRLRSLHYEPGLLARRRLGTRRPNI